MPYLVDGHNLIPKLGLQLDSFDDEDCLVVELQEFCRLRRTRLEVYFDGAPPGHPASRKAGAVTAYFIRQGASADAAIEARLEALRGEARNWTVVSSDRRVQGAARATRAAVLPAEEFARQVQALRSPRGAAAGQEASLSPQEVDEWLSFFKRRKG
ncbi:MAG: NYN domain-containing protein [Chloroflexi bacterium]|nr:NYN domain-containing protein [Chloroflexota bacterium]